MGSLAELLSQLEKMDETTLMKNDRIGGLEIAELVELISHPVDQTVVGQKGAEPDLSIEELSEHDVNRGLESLRLGTVGCCLVLRNREIIHSGKLSSVLNSLSYVKTKWILVPPEIFSECSARIDEHHDVVALKGFESFRLLPDNTVHFADGSPTLHWCGDGDVFPSMRESNVVTSFLNEGGKSIVVIDADAELVPGVVGRHVRSEVPITCCVMKKDQLSSRQFLCDCDGVKQIIEKSRFLRDEFEESWVPNFMVLRMELADPGISTPWHRMKRTSNGMLFIQHERFLADLTSDFKTEYVALPFNGKHAL